jgi:hypothetical protein
MALSRALNEAKKVKRLPYRYGHAARERFGFRHPEWSPELEATLKSEWNEARRHVAHEWEAVKRPACSGSLRGQGFWERT